MDDSRISRAELLIAKTQLISLGWTIRFNDNIGFASQFQEYCSTIRLFDVERNAALVGIEVEEVQTFLGMR